MSQDKSNFRQNTRKKTQSLKYAKSTCGHGSTRFQGLSDVLQYKDVNEPSCTKKRRRLDVNIAGTFTCTLKGKGSCQLLLTCTGSDVDVAASSPFLYSAVLLVFSCLKVAQRVSNTTHSAVRISFVLNRPLSIDCRLLPVVKSLYTHGLKSQRHDTRYAFGRIRRQKQNERKRTMSEVTTQFLRCLIGSSAPGVCRSPTFANLWSNSHVP